MHSSIQQVHDCRLHIHSTVEFNDPMGSGGKKGYSLVYTNAQHVKAEGSEAVKMQNKQIFSHKHTHSAMEHGEMK